MLPDEDFRIQRLRQVGATAARYPVEQLDPHESFMARDPSGEFRLCSVRNAIYAAIRRARRYWRKQGIVAVYSARRVDDGFVIWRIK